MFTGATVVDDRPARNSLQTLVGTSSKKQQPLRLNKVKVMTIYLNRPKNPNNLKTCRDKHRES